MKTIEIDDDIYMHILRNPQQIGESGSSILRRLLGLNRKDAPASTVPNDEKPGLENHLTTMDFRCAKGAVGKFLSVLGFVYQNNKGDFAKVENIKGRGRLYFARDEETLNSSGQSVNPKQIPGSPFWVISTTPTSLKQEILESAMKMFGYSTADIRKATSAISPRQQLFDSL